MKAFFDMTSIFFKHRLKSRVFLISAASLLLIFVCFIALCPASAPISAKIGIMYDSSIASLNDACAPLLDSEYVSFSYYPLEKENDIKLKVMSGDLHCAYKIEPTDDVPITVYENERSFLTPITDELVFCAWFEMRLPDLAASLYKNGEYDELIRSEMQRQALSDNPLTPNIRLNAAASGKTGDSMNMSPLIYAVLVSLALICAVFCQILMPKSEAETMQLLKATAKNKCLPFASALTAQAALFAIVLLLCEAAMLAANVENSYSLIARAAMLLLLAALATAVSWALSLIRHNSATLFALIVWAAVSVIFSGALISPSLFGELQAIKYISPSWLLLRLMTFLS